MNNLKEMQQKTLKNSLALLVIMVIITGGIFYWARPYVTNAVKGPSQEIELVDIWTGDSTYDEFKKNEVVSLNTPYIDDNFAEYYTKDKYSSKKTTTDVYYFLFIDEQALILEVPSEYSKDADFLIEQLYNETPFEDLVYNTYTGILINTDSKVKDYAMKYVNESYDDITITNANYSEYFMPYTFKVLTPSDKYASIELIVLYISFILLLVSILTYMRALLLNKKYVQRLNPRLSSDNEASRFESDINSSSAVRIGKSIYMTKNWFVLNRFLKSKAIHLDDIAWAYLSEVKRRGVTSSYLIIKTIDEKVNKFTLANSDVRETLSTMVESAPWAVYGYSKESEEFFKKKNWPNAVRVITDRRNEIKNQLFGAMPYTDKFE